jgi:hypothetical protein
MKKEKDTMSIKEKGTMSDTLSKGLRTTVGDLTDIVRNVDELIEHLRGNDSETKPWLGDRLEYESVCGELEREFANRLANILSILEQFEEGGEEYEDLEEE